MTKRLFMVAAVIPALAVLQGFQKKTEDPWTSADLLQPKQLAVRMADKNAKQPKILYVGFGVLYRAKHISGAVYAGPCSKPEGLDRLKHAVANLSPDSEIVIYCGCCPFQQCPNIRPAFRALRAIGFHNVKVLELPENFHKDWEAKGYPSGTP